MIRYGMRQPWGASINTPFKLEKARDGEYVAYADMIDIITDCIHNANENGYHQTADDLELLLEKIDEVS